MKRSAGAGPGALDRRSAWRSFDRAAASYGAHDALQREVARRLVEHLDPIRIDPKRVLEVGCGPGSLFEALRGRFPRAMLIGIDASLPMLRKAARQGSWWRRALGTAPALACGDAEQLPLTAGCAQLALSNLMLPWCDPARVFAEVARALEVGGLFLFSTCGPDTLKELRHAFDDGAAHVHAFVDMHDLGDALVAAGFADPVMEMETLTLEYSSVEALARELKGCGAHSALPDRLRGLGGRASWMAMKARYERLRRDAALPATFEIVYGHAWKTAPRTTADGRQVIAFRDRPR